MIKHVLMETGIGIMEFYPILFFSISCFRGGAFYCIRLLLAKVL